MAVKKMQEAAIKTIILGQQVRLWVDRKMPILQKAVREALFHVNFFLDKHIGYNLNDARA